jgi:hypothetical protein
MPSSRAPASIVAGADGIVPAGWRARVACSESPPIPQGESGEIVAYTVRCGAVRYGTGGRAMSLSFECDRPTGGRVDGSDEERLARVVCVSCVCARVYAVLVTLPRSSFSFILSFPTTTKKRGKGNAKRHKDVDGGVVQ